MLETFDASHDLATAHDKLLISPAPHPSRSPSRKRRRNDDSNEELESFEILPCPHSHLDKPVAATALFIIPRAGLPLSFLAFQRVTDALPSTRFFSANIKCLEDPPRRDAFLQTKGHGRILIAKLEGEQNLYAIERVREGVYSIFRLVSSVDVRRLQLCTAPTSGREPLGEYSSASDEWWASTSVAKYDRPSKRHKHVDDSHNHQETRSSPAEPMHSAEVEYTVLHFGDPQAVTEVQAAQPTSQDTLSNLIGQYLDALYMSKTSLAYFAKGPLSRSRAAFSADGKLDELTAFLGSLILSVSTADKKYKTLIPELVKSFAAPGDTRTSRPKKKRTLKPNKDGLFPDETSFVRNWWRNNEQGLLAVDKDDFLTSLTVSVSQLRFRETLLQLILILETLAVESTLSSAIEDNPSRLERNAAQEEPDGEGKNFIGRAKKPRSLQTLVDTLVDRLTIWQSVGSADADNEDLASKESSKADRADLKAESGKDSDQLKDFFLQVVTPFYGSRLPALVDGLNRKLGATSGISPARRVTTSISSQSAKITPGTELLRQKPPRTKNAINRVRGGESTIKSTERSKAESTSQSSTREKSVGVERRTLSRSGSLSQPGDSRAALSRTSSFSHSRDKSHPLSRSNSISQTNQTLKQREVDFSAIGKFYQAKLKKKLDVEQELKDAIAALKRPNRDLAGKEFMEAAHDRVSSTKSQKPFHPARRKIGNGVAINATPKRINKTKNTIAATPDRPLLQPADASTQNKTSSNSCIPGSTIRPQPSIVSSSNSQPRAIISSTPVAKPVPRPIFETPSRGNEKTPWRLQDSARAVTDPNFVFQTPTKVSSSLPRRSTVTAGYAPNRSLRQTETGDAQPAATAMDHLALHGNENFETCARPMSKGNEESIYESLGWDDVDELT